MDNIDNIKKMIAEDFNGLELSIQAITKAYNEMDKDIYDLCFNQ